MAKQIVSLAHETSSVASWESILDWEDFLKILIHNAILLTVLGATILGGIGFLLVGKDGLVNGITWGIILGIVSVPIPGMMFATKFWGDYAGQYGS